MKTAVSWLEESLIKLIAEDGSIQDFKNNSTELLKQAKEMEKQQIKSARHSGRQDLRDNGAMYKEDEQYYNELYGK